MTWQAVVKRIDFMGGFLSIVGLTLFLVALQAGGYSHSWTSAYTLCTLLVGLALIATWLLYEAKFARHPMIPSEVGQTPVNGCILMLTATSFSWANESLHFPLRSRSSEA
jgi:hypothetical protein